MSRSTFQRFATGDDGVNYEIIMRNFYAFASSWTQRLFIANTFGVSQWQKIKEIKKK